MKELLDKTYGIGTTKEYVPLLAIQRTSPILIIIKNGESDYSLGIVIIDKIMKLKKGFTNIFRLLTTAITKSEAISIAKGKEPISELFLNNPIEVVSKIGSNVMTEKFDTIEPKDLQRLPQKSAKMDGSIPNCHDISEVVKAIRKL